MEDNRKKLDESASEKLVVTIADGVVEKIAKRVYEALATIERHNNGEPWARGEAQEFVDWVDDEIFGLNPNVFWEDIDIVAESMYRCPSLTTAFDSRFKPGEIWFGPVYNQEIADEVFGTSDRLAKYPNVKYLTSVLEPCCDTKKLIRIPRGVKFHGRGGVFAVDDAYYLFSKAMPDKFEYLVAQIRLNAGQNRLELMTLDHEDDVEDAPMMFILNAFIKSVKQDLQNNELEVKKFCIFKANPAKGANSVKFVSPYYPIALLRDCPLLHKGNLLNEILDIANYKILQETSQHHYSKKPYKYHYVAERDNIN